MCVCVCGVCVCAMRFRHSTYIPITGYLCDSEIYAFFKAISNVCGFYLCTALHGDVAILSVDINYVNHICAISVLLA